MKIIMLSGYLQSGKDTVADYLVENYNFKRLAFADILKDEVSNIYSIKRYLLDTTEGKNELNEFYKKTNRKILIDHGQEKRDINKDYWVNSIVNQINKNDGLYVISDWRFENEYVRIKNEFKNVISIRIERYLKSSIQDISETSLDDYEFDYILKNTNTLNDLYKKTDNLMDKLL